MGNIKTEGFPDDETIILDELSATYMQENDCTESGDEYQILTISTRDGGGGKFLNLKTDSWSITDKDELIAVIDDFKRRLDCNS